MQGAGAKVLDWHTCDLFPERWIDLVVVLRCDHSQLWSRLEKRCVCTPPDRARRELTSSCDPRPANFTSFRLPIHISRGYKLNKIQENNDAEIMEVVLNDARESYAEEIVVVLQSETPDQMEENVGRIIQWVAAWRENNADDEDEA